MESLKTILFCWLASGLLLSAALPVTAQEKARETTLRITGGPEGTFEQRYGGTYITSVRVDVKNIGSVQAENITVLAVLPNGQRENLSGPSSLAPNKSATYSASTYEVVTTTKKISAELSCANCR